MIINLEARDGTSLVVLTEKCAIIYQGKTYVNPRGNPSVGFNRVIDELVYLTERDMMQAGSWPVVWRVFGGRWLGLYFSQFGAGAQTEEHAFHNLRLDYLPLDTSCIPRLRFVLRLNRKRNHLLAVGMMTHARLGEACALNRFPEVVKMVMEAM
jgi:hypothetical protein